MLAQITEHGDHMDRNVPVSTFSGKPMWDILDIQDGDIHGEGLQNRTESQVGKDQMGGESGKGDRDTPQRGASRVSARLPSSGPEHHPWTTRRTFPVVSGPNPQTGGWSSRLKRTQQKMETTFCRIQSLSFLLEESSGGMTTITPSIGRR